MLPEIVPGSIELQAPYQLGIPVEGYEGFDEDASYQLMEEITKDSCGTSTFQKFLTGR